MAHIKLYFSSWNSRPAATTAHFIAKKAIFYSKMTIFTVLGPEITPEIIKFQNIHYSKHQFRDQRTLFYQENTLLSIFNKFDHFSPLKLVKNLKSILPRFCLTESLWYLKKENSVLKADFEKVRLSMPVHVPDNSSDSYVYEDIPEIEKLDTSNDLTTRMLIITQDNLKKVNTGRSLCYKKTKKSGFYKVNIIRMNVFQKFSESI